MAAAAASGHILRRGRLPKSLFLLRQKKRSFDDQYTRGHKLGAGAFANVFVGVHKETQEEYAVKQIMDRSKMVLQGRDMLKDEIDNLKLLKDGDPSVVQFQDFFEGNGIRAACFLVLELLRGGELFEKLYEKRIFTEGEAQDSCRCVLSALDYMHDKRIVHRDLKPENLMLANDDLKSVKLCDFGFSRLVEKKNSLTTHCGTVGFMAPEVLERWPSYDVQCDIWSFGVIMFFMLGGENPFDPPGASEKDCIELTTKGRFYFRPDRWKDLSFECKDLVACCLKINPKQRINAKRALNHGWLAPKKPKKRTTRISAVTLESTLKEMRKAKLEEKVPKKERMDKLGAELKDFLANRRADSFVSLMTNTTGTRTSVRGGVSVQDSLNMNFEEDSPTGLPFSAFYKVGAELGKGGFAVVSRCTHTRSSQTFAVKQIDCDKMNDHQRDMLKHEIKVMKFLRGAPYVIRLFDVFEEPGKTFLVMDEMKGGDLLDRVLQKAIYTEREARDLGKYLFEAVKYCHSKNIAHRDIKLENLLMVDNDSDACIKLADFGFAKRTPHGKGLRTFCGTPKYMAPEIFLAKTTRKSYGFSCDMWSAGVVMYTLVTGCLPFNQKTTPEVEAKVLKGEYTFEVGDGCSTPALQAMISGLLTVDPNERMTAAQAVECQWMGLDSEELSVCDLTVSKERLSILRDSLRNDPEAMKHVVEAANKMVELSSGPENKIYPEASNEKEDEEQEEAFDQCYTLGEDFMDTLHGQLHYATHKATNEKYCVKRVIRRVLHPREAKAVNDEIEVLRAAAECQQTVTLHGVYDDPDITHIVLEHIEGQPLIEQLIERKSINEGDTKVWMRNLLTAVDFLHKRKIASRNITLDNLVLVDGSESDVKLYDFEFAKKVPFKNCLHTQCGVQEYLAPEVLENSPAYDVPCDMWSVGVVVFLLLGGYYPFRGATEEETLKNSRYGLFQFKKKYWEEISDDVQTLIKQMLTVDPDDRISAAAALESSWLTNDDSGPTVDLTLNMKELRTSVNATLIHDMANLTPPSGKRKSVSPGFRVSYFGG